MTSIDGALGRIVGVQVGRIRALGPDAVASAFAKTAVEGPVAVSARGLDGDEQADLTVHGGVDKAVYAYAVENYPLWAEDYPRHELLFRPGGMGENLSIAGLTESAICLGDRYRVGETLLEVSQPRMPCSKLALYYRDPSMVRAMVKNLRSGWYCRVIEPGRVARGDAVRREAQPHPEWPIARLNALVRAKAATPEELAALARLAVLADDWRGAVPGLAEASARPDMDRDKS